MKMDIKQIGGIALAIITFVGTTLGVWFSIENRVKRSITSSATRITEEIQKATLDIVGMHRDDLEIRLRILKQEIRAKKQSGEPIPERTEILRDALQDQLEEMKEKWYQK